MKKHYNAPMLKVYKIEMVSRLMEASTTTVSVSKTNFDEGTMTSLSRRNGNSLWADDEEE
jgi:hypothetical protein